MPGGADDLKLLAELCDDAVARHGVDIGQIERYVEAAIARLPGHRQQSLRASLSEFLQIQRALAAERGSSH